MPPTLSISAVRLRIRGRVQGVGFRPFVCRLAHTHGLAGWAYNDEGGVHVHIEGSGGNVEQFLDAIRCETPPSAHVESLEQEQAAATGTTSFQILTRPNQHMAASRARVPPDRATCDICLEDTRNPDDQRYLYPFTTCTVCGPRYSILERLPYERRNTSMRSFPLCCRCAGEFNDSANRRFHAEPMACPICGPHVSFRTGEMAWQIGESALVKAAEVLRDGRILALKGLGGFQLVVRADSTPAVARLRERKHRPTKPLAVMAGSVDQAHFLAHIGPLAHQLLESPENPIVLVEKKATCLAPEIAPGLGQVGIMLPTTPLHNLLLEQLDFPLVVTSGNTSENPILIDEAEADSLADIADAWLVHDRPIRRRVDDSVVRVIGDKPVMLRLARGYALAAAGAGTLGPRKACCTCSGWSTEIIRRPLERRSGGLVPTPGRS